MFATDSAYAKSVSFSNFESNIIADHLAFSCAFTDAYTRENEHFYNLYIDNRSIFVFLAHESSAFNCAFRYRCRPWDRRQSLRYRRLQYQRLFPLPCVFLANILKQNQMYAHPVVLGNIPMSRNLLGLAVVFCAKEGPTLAKLHLVLAVCVL